MKLNNVIAKKMTFGLVCLISTNVSLMSNVYAAEKEPKSKLVSIMQATQQNISPVAWLPGNVTSRLNARLSSEQSGRLVWILDVGAVVNEGQAVAKLDTQSLELQLAERQTLLRQQKTNTTYLQKQHKRLSALLNNNSTARIELDRVERDLAVAKEELNNLKIQIKRTQLAIERATIRAPFDGNINQRMAQKGEYISVGTPLVQLVDPKSLDISISAPLALAPYLQNQDEILVKWSDHIETLPVRTWSPAGEQSSRTFNVRLDASQLSLMSGTAVSVSLPKDSPSLSTMVPRDALILREKRTFVMTVDGENKAHHVDVSVGRGQGELVAVSGQITAGDNVIVRGGERLKDGDKVRIQKLELTDQGSQVAVN